MPVWLVVDRERVSELPGRLRRAGRRMRVPAGHVMDRLHVPGDRREPDARATAAIRAAAEEAQRVDPAAACAAAGAEPHRQRRHGDERAPSTERHAVVVALHARPVTTVERTLEQPTHDRDVCRVQEWHGPRGSRVPVPARPGVGWRSVRGVVRAHAGAPRQHVHVPAEHALDGIALRALAGVQGERGPHGRELHPVEPEQEALSAVQPRTAQRAAHCSR